MDCHYNLAKTNNQMHSTVEKLCRMLISGEFVFKFERGFVQCCDLAPLCF